MKPIHIFSAGRHTAMSGVTLDFSEAQLAAAAAAYDPALHEAPIVVGHPRADGPAYGWVAGLTSAGGALTATPQQVDAAFAEMVQAGRFKKVSAAFYLPDARGNPKPGSLYLRHVGFLGAQPPAVKGLKQVDFAEGEEGIVEFSEDGWTIGSMGRLFRGMREFFIGKYGQEEADKALPAWDIESIERRAVEKNLEDRPTGSAFAEPGTPAAPPSIKETPLSGSQDEAARAAELAERETRLAAREAAAAERDAADRKRDDAAFVEGLVQSGQLIPAVRGQVLAFMAQLDTTGTVEFAEGQPKMTPAAAFRQLLTGLPKIVHFGEVAPNGPAVQADPSNPTDIQRKAVEFQEAAKLKGIVVSDIEAVKAVTGGVR